MRAVPGDETRSGVPPEQEQADGAQLVVPGLHQQVVQGPPRPKGDRALISGMSLPWTTCMRCHNECRELNQLFRLYQARCLGLSYFSHTQHICSTHPACLQSPVMVAQVTTSLMIVVLSSR